MADNSHPPTSPPAIPLVASPRCLTASGAVLRRVRFESPLLAASLAPSRPSLPSGVSLDFLVTSLSSSSGGTADDDGYGVAVSAAS